MDVRPEILLLILGCGLVTLLPRVLPLVLLRKVAFPGWLQDWLSYIPVTVMAALVAQELIPADGDWRAAVPAAVAAIACLVCALQTRNLLWTVLCGLLVVNLVNLL